MTWSTSSRTPNPLPRHADGWRDGTVKAYADGLTDLPLDRQMHQTIRKVGDDIAVPSRQRLGQRVALDH